MLSSLLLWQLVAGMFVHAHDMASQPQHATSDATNVDMTVPMMSQDEQCADHMATTSESTDGVQMDMHAHLTSDTDANEQTQDSADAGCCQSAFCKCPCVHAVALPVAIPNIAAVDDVPPAPVATASLLHIGVSGLFRPPI